jgi:hypothetical protein
MPRRANGNGRDWRRDCKKKPSATAEFSPLSQRKAQQRRDTVMPLRSGVGVVKVIACYGWDPERRRWGCPMRERWGLEPRQELTPGLEDRLAFTITATGSYSDAAAVAQKWMGESVDDTTLHILAQRLGQRAEEQLQARLKSVPQELTPQRAPSELAVFELDGWQARYRGPGFGKKKTKKKRVEWHEVKLGVFYFQEQAAVTGKDRGLLSEKVMVSWVDEGGTELGRRLHWEAMRRGVGRAKYILVLGDGAPWVWNVAKDRWLGATELLDFYHASQHVWALGKALYGEDQAKEWVESRLHELRHGQEKEFLEKIAQVKVPRGERGKTVRKERKYFPKRAKRLNYQEIAERGWPIGSGAVESACSGHQGRFKRRGQLWTKPGLRNLAALKQARENKYWDELWFAA